MIVWLFDHYLIDYSIDYLMLTGVIIWFDSFEIIWLLFDDYSGSIILIIWCCSDDYLMIISLPTTVPAARRRRRGPRPLALPRRRGVGNHWYCYGAAAASLNPSAATAPQRPPGNIWLLRHRSC